MSLVMNGLVAWNAFKGQGSDLVHCSIKSSMGFGLRALLIQDLVLAAVHMAFVIYMKRQVTIHYSNTDGGPMTAQAVFETVKQFIQYDFGFCIYVFVWVYAFYLNATGLNVVFSCTHADEAAHGKPSPETEPEADENWNPFWCVLLMVLYAPVSLSYVCCFYYCNMCRSCMSGARRTPARARESQAGAAAAAADYRALPGEPDAKVFLVA
jgi:hypothetical protein